MTDVELLQAKITGSGLKLRFIAEKMGMSYPTFLESIRGKRDFTQTEIKTICEILNIPASQVRKFFLADMSTK